MSASLLAFFVAAKAPDPGMPLWLSNLLQWFYFFGEPLYTAQVHGIGTLLLAGGITWLKVVSLFCLLGWTLSWVSTAMKERHAWRGDWLDVSALGALVLASACVLVSVLESTKRIGVYKLLFVNIYVVNLMAAVAGLLLFLWLLRALWAGMSRLGSKGDILVLLGVHLALVLGLAVGFGLRYRTNFLNANTTTPMLSMLQGLTVGLRIGGTFMGYVVLLRVALQLLVELVSMRSRRLYSLAKLTWVESFRRMWAPWVVVVVFLLVIAFTHWFLQPPRPAEVGRQFVYTLSFLCSLLLTLMVALLTPLSLPHDIQSQTIYTVVSKPVRRIEIVWGRIFGFMAIVTVLIVAFGGISLFYLMRTVGGTIEATNNAAARALKANRLTEARQLKEQAEQISTRMAARVPLYGALTFLDSKGTPHLRGIDVGQEQSMREPRSHIEGATPAAAIWSYGIVRDPLAPEGRGAFLDHRLPVSSLLVSDSLEGLENQAFELSQQIKRGEQATAAGGEAAAKVKNLTASLASFREELKRVTDEYSALKTRADDLEAKAEKASQPAEAQELRDRAEALHSPPIPLEMVFNVYRTTKGRIGEPVSASLQVTNPLTGAEFTNIFPIREYYTNRQAIPARLLAGSGGALTVKVRCISPTQYLGMAQSDLFVLSSKGDFGTNFMKGLFGVWLQALVLTSIGVFAGTFLSWRVALLTTLSFFVAGEVAFNFLLSFSDQTLLGGGPFESFIRMITHDNQMSDLTPTLPVVTAKTFDAIVMPVMSRLAYIVPNFSALDVSTPVSDGFAVSWTVLGINTLLSLGYAIPFSVAGFYILKHREVAA